MIKNRYDITRTTNPAKVRTFIENCRGAGDDTGVRIGRDHLFVVLAENIARDFAPQLMHDPLVIRFLEMMVCVEELRGTRAARTRNALKAGHDTIATIERLLRQWAKKGTRPEDGTETFHFLKNAGRLDLTGEALLLDFCDRFAAMDAQAVAEARERLAYFGYRPAVELRRQYWEEVDAGRARASLEAAMVAAKHGLTSRDATIPAVPASHESFSAS